MTVFVYINPAKEVGDIDYVKVFANREAAERWFEENDPEGVAFEYEVIECEPRRPPHDHDRGADRSVHAALEFALSSEPRQSRPCDQTRSECGGRSQRAERA